MDWPLTGAPLRAILWGRIPCCIGDTGMIGIYRLASAATTPRRPAITPAASPYASTVSHVKYIGMVAEYIGVIVPSEDHTSAASLVIVSVALFGVGPG